jgi:hypothetical protein
MRKLLREHWILLAALPFMLVLAAYTGAFGEMDFLDIESATNPTLPKGRFSIGTTNSDTSEIFSFGNYKNFSYQARCVSASDDVKYDLELYTALANDKNAMIEIGSGNLIDDSTAETWSAPASIQIPVATNGYFKFTGVSGNTHDTLCDFRVVRER